MLKIEWRRGPDLPQGFQDSDGGFIGDSLITVGGFCSGVKADNERKPGRYPRGFLDKVWGLDTSKKDAAWESMPQWPGEARQGLFAAIVDGVMYFWGGFSYTEPFSYSDGFKLSRKSNEWKWDKLPPLPYLLTSAALCVIDKRIYMVGGADYDGKIGFHTEADREAKIPRLGARFWVLDTGDLKAGWKELAPLPGTPRFVHAVSAVNNKIYVIGGAVGICKDEKQNYGSCTVVDNWVFNFSSNKWARLRDLPISSGNFPRSSNLVYRNRYIILPGGHQYAWAASPEGVKPQYGQASSVRKESGLYNDCFVYDTKTDLFGTADKLPIDNNLPMAVVRDDKIYLLGGETGGGEIDGVYYGHHPDLLLIGKISEVSAP